MDKSNNEKNIFKASAQRNNILASLQEQSNQSVKQLELGFVILVHSSDRSLLFSPSRRQDSLI